MVTGYPQNEKNEEKNMRKLLLDNRDEDLLEALHTFIYLDSGTINEFVYKDIARSTSYRRLRIIEEKGFIKSFEGIYNESYSKVYTLTPAGVNLVEEITGYSNWNKNWSYQLPAWYLHTIKVARIKYSYEESYDEILEFKEFVNEQRAYYSFEGEQNSKRTLRPDGFIVLGNEDFNIGLFIEMENSRTKRPVVKDKLARYKQFFDSEVLREKYIAHLQLLEEVDSFYLLFVSENKNINKLLKTIFTREKPKDGKKTIDRPGIDIPVRLTSLEDLEHTPYGDIYQHIDEEDDTTKQMIV
ncbi:replication-relaxation family protein [Staphylococcus agnetis]|uniref:replication-relaxation family protein n=1 Tax=Staphylococcus TaxID=1279 RepID=UPI00208EEFA2|nr:replication-relaxation family protein [Staphylococcus agnetis]MCO4353540.1 replication-relaxation family protein [Staphylococcus agnetis]